MCLGQRFTGSARSSPRVRPNCGSAGVRTHNSGDFVAWEASRTRMVPRIEERFSLAQLVEPFLRFGDVLLGFLYCARRLLDGTGESVGLPIDDADVVFQLGHA